MIVIDHWKCTSCGESFETSDRRLEDLVLVPDCPRCGSLRTQVKLEWERESGGRNHSPRLKRKKKDFRQKSGINAQGAWKGGKANDRY